MSTMSTSEMMFGRCKQEGDRYSGCRDEGVGRMHCYFGGIFTVSEGWSVSSYGGRDEICEETLVVRYAEDSKRRNEFRLGSSVYWFISGNDDVCHFIG